MSMIPYVINGGGLIMVRDGAPQFIHKGDKKFNMLVALLQEGNFDGVEQYLQDPNLGIINRFIAVTGAADLAETLKKRFAALGETGQEKLAKFLAALCPA